MVELLFTMKKYLIIGIISLALIGSVLVGSVYLGWQNSFGWSIARMMSLPALRINETTFSVADFMADQTSINTTQETKDLTLEQKNSLIIEKLKQEGVIDSLIKQFNLEINQRDIANLEQELLLSASDKPLTENEIRETFGYSAKNFTRRVAIPYYNRLQLQKYFIFNTPNSDKDKIIKIREQLIQKPDDFSLEAKKLSGQEPIEHIVLATDLQGDYKHLLAIPAGGISGVVANADGYRLFRVSNIIADDAKGTYYQLHELFIPTTIFQEKLNEALALASEHWFIKKPQVAAAE